MLISCPKCGFSQPKDQYCAQCGVDMLAYRAPKKSLGQKLFENLRIQMILIFLLGVGVFYFFKNDPKDPFWNRVQFLRNKSTQVARSNTQHQFSAPSLPPAAAPSKKAAAAEVSENTQPKAAQVEQKQDDKKPETRITYLEVSTEILNKWLEEGILNRAETSDGITIAYIPQFEKILELSKDQVKVLKETTFPYTVHQLHTAKLENYPPKSTDADIPSPNRVLANEAPAAPAINAYATIDEEREETISGQLEVTTNPQTTIPAHFEMTSDQTFFMTGFARPRTADKAPTVESGRELVVILQILK